jgi:hypothetical protein
MRPRSPYASVLFGSGSVDLPFWGKSEKQKTFRKIKTAAMRFITGILHGDARRFEIHEKINKKNR